MLKSVLCNVVIFCVLAQTSLQEDRECAARPIPGESVVCVCNSTYCDEITRETPSRNCFVTYTTTKDGLRFYKDGGTIQSVVDTLLPLTTFDLDVQKLYQPIVGFGGSITDSAGINWKSLKDPQAQQYLIDSYFSDKGLEYNLIRTPIGGSDFSVRSYAFNEIPIDDKYLTNYELSPEDYNYKIPMFKAAKAASKDALGVVATVWSPPDWMKTPNSHARCGTLKPEYYQTYADYFLKFIDLYTKQGIDIWAISPSNEPTNYLYGEVIKFNCMEWKSNAMGEFISKNLGPTVRRSVYNNTVILALDDQRYSIPLFFDEMIKSHPKTLKYIDGICLHAYFDNAYVPTFLEEVTVPYPNMIILITEFCVGTGNNIDVLLGSWIRAASYITHIMQNLIYGANGFIDWNLCLDEEGGPNWAGNFVDSAIIVYPELGEFLKQPIFYAMGHFAKFIPRGSIRIDVTQTVTVDNVAIDIVAFLTPRRTVVVVLYNPTESASVCLKLGKGNAIVECPSDSIVTVEISSSNIVGT